MCIVKLNLPIYKFRFKEENGRKKIFDQIRKKYYVLSPEEWVRQNIISYLIDEKKYPASLIAVETKVDVNKLPQRSDIVLYSNNLKPLMIVECKAPEVKITQQSFNQITRYNMILRVPLLFVSNGLNHYCCHYNYAENSYKYLKEIPNYKEALNML
ncbi:MAG: type I restriction enzyme HsdR N-terminal domain-containing protein [Marinifilaceae bacterium]|jgi:type I site-specific restriction endonuclease|nr:type I restriction enzyme HsdR N-terminal domain-containing protein [Marinifilaceae bacterium]